MSIIQISLDSGFIPPYSEIEHEATTTTVSEDVRELAHPDDVAAMQAELTQACDEFEYLKAHEWSPASLEHVKKIPILSPTSNQSPPMDLNQYYSPQPSATPPAPLESPTWSQPEHDGSMYANEPNFAQNYYPTVLDLELWAAGDPRAYGPIPPYSQGQNTRLQTELSISSVTEDTSYAYDNANTFLPSASDSDATTYLSDGNGLESSLSTPDETACAKPPKHKKYTVESEEDSSSSSLAPTTRMRRCLEEVDEEIGEGKFDVYKLADASAVHDPEPVDISNRRTHDDFGNLLRTRRIEAMELDDSYSNQSVKITNELPAEMTRVRSYDWTDQPGGPFVEMNKTRVAQHPLHWHSVKSKDTGPCKLVNCSKPEAMLKSGNHIEGVHCITSYECPYCGKQWSRSESLDRYQEKYDPLLASNARAKEGYRQFSLQDPKKLV